ncbi:HD domain-containing protein [Flammeovirga yaeyamensis]|uniref:HD domain-containing protein n=1 Tax=Flammeovirga yaeyamensis TaxID=367791 RepID=A0AAX1MYU9_9BACT|nr:HD domain-containing protein [Flammeovirga yaeyamensis]MBB3696184.1 putative nucleotidyltransferase with HDIG domain [Flammeovirga yaeyamensis]NMF34867.1 HD domain-containing protein [Flammeovirga yaeyamensis]QWG00306.1 HD domain-containing protein [Flammeovirga yaeyamensis]
MNFKDILDQNPIFDVVANSAKSVGFDTYLVGGFVRDLLLKRPSKDIDIVCVGSGIVLAEEVAKQGGNLPCSTFKSFGTAMVKFDEYEVEFVGARRESYRRESRKPIVEDGTLEDDQNRRDFTINALAISLNQDNYGDLVDPFGGVQDLEKKNIITPLEPNITFSDDPLRMMRAIRFASQLNFDIDPDTFDAIVDNKERISIVSKERIMDELNKIILSPVPSYGFKLLFTSGLLQLIFPEMQNLHGVERRDGKGHKDNFYHTLKVLDNVAEKSNDLWLRWAAILHDIAKPATKRFNQRVGWTFHGHEDKGARMVPGIFKRLKLPLNDKMKFVQKLVKLHLRPIALVKKEVTDSAVRRLLFEAGDDIDALMMLCRADITSKDGNKVKKYLSNFDYVESRLEAVEESDKVRNFQPVITGELVMQTFDIKPSREVGQIKDQVREAILDGKIKNTLEEAKPFMINVGIELGLTPLNTENE